jgi:FlaA1/EpsC-like NDP-sugar epimerase
MLSDTTILITGTSGTIVSEIIKHILGLDRISANLHIKAAVHSVNNSNTSSSKNLDTNDYKN